MIFGKAIEYPPAPFEPGDYVKFRFEDEARESPGWYKVLASCHTHTQIEGRHYAVLNWQLKRVRRKKS